MPRRNIVNWNRIREMCIASFPLRSDKEVDIMATEMARVQAEDKVAAFEHKAEVAQQALAEVVEAAARQAEQALEQAEAVVAKEVCNIPNFKIKQK
ncbi:hypothetical protein QYE76_007491 [Lolium multiflorum]|uniref:Uncharacterized protein n=1 Tax=Lolium multiflorum TaxID=4521 RepID=A0AAD8S080_LOLMU|nr:hypothetical protein QYE76_007491 [Lolium multiflorum]